MECLLMVICNLIKTLCKIYKRLINFINVNDRNIETTNVTYSLILNIIKGSYSL